MPTVHGLPLPPSGVVIDGSEVLWVDKEIGGEWFTYQFTVAEVIASMGGGSVSSVGLTMPGIFAVGGSPVTTAGTLAVTLATQTANRVWAGPVSGIAATPSFRALVWDDVPLVSALSGVSGVLSTDLVMLEAGGIKFQATVAQLALGATTPTTTKGDMIVRSASADSRLAVGLNYSRLMPDSAVSLGVKWVFDGGVPLAYFGTLHNDGTTDDGALINTALASGAKYIDARGLNIAITTTVNQVAGVYLDMRGCAISTPGSTLTTFKADTVDDFVLDLRGATITGGGSSVGTAKAVHIKGCNRGIVIGGRALNIKGHGFYLEPGSLSTPRGDQMLVNDFLSDTCYWGYEDTPGTGAEYAILTNFRTSNCTTWGVQTTAGNVQWIGGHDVDNVGDNFIMLGGANHAHGIVDGRAMNHAGGTYNIKLVGVTLGQTFIGCHSFEKDILLDGCNGIKFVGGILDVPNITVNSGTGSGECTLTDVQFQNAYGNPTTINGTDPNSLVTKENNGAGNPGNNDIKTKSISAAYTYLINDESVVHDSADATARVVTINSIANLPQRVGKVLSGDNMVGAGVITLAITTDVLVWLPTGATGSRSIAAGGNWAVKLVKIAAGVGTWHLSGNGIT